jgi:hypothetical protein
MDIVHVSYTHAVERALTSHLPRAVQSVHRQTGKQLQTSQACPTLLEHFFTTMAQINLDGMQNPSFLMRKANDTAIEDKAIPEGMLLPAGVMYERLTGGRNSVRA